MSARRIWIIDPLDSTTGSIFRAGIDIPSVLVALREDGVVKVGVIFFPLTGEYFYAVRGSGAYKNGVRIRIKTPVPSLREAWIDMNQYGDSSYETPAFEILRKRLRLPGGARLVTSLVPHSGIVARIVEGQKMISAVIHDNNPKKMKQAPWDVAAPQLFFEEAGGVFLNLEGRKYDPFNPELIIAAASGELAFEIINLLK